MIGPVNWQGSWACLVTNARDIEAAMPDLLDLDGINARVVTDMQQPPRCGLKAPAQGRGFARRQ